MKLKIHSHELSVALAKVRLFRCFETHLDSNCTKRRKVEEEETQK